MEARIMLKLGAWPTNDGSCCVPIFVIGGIMTDEAISGGYYDGRTVLIITITLLVTTLVLFYYTQIWKIIPILYEIVK